MFTHAIILDFEATCDSKGFAGPQEIIEFPSVLLDLERGVVCDEFTSFVRPVHNPQLSDFCRELTGIQQGEVDAAKPFPEVLAKHTTWLEKHGLNESNALFVTCGDWDLKQMWPIQLAAAKIDPQTLPRIYGQWQNIKVLYCQVFDQPRVGSMVKMLRGLQMELQGRHHRGIDDCRNIARIYQALIDKGGKVEVTGKLEPRDPSS